MPTAGSKSEQPMFVYDGDCAFCTTSTRWIARRLPPATLVEPWQRLDLPSLGLTERDVRTAAYWIGPDGHAYRGHRAITRSLSTARGGWGLVGRVLSLPPLSWLAAPVYWLVARNRHKLPGSTEACRLPTHP